MEPRAPSSPNLKINVALSLVLGTILGAGIAFVLELFDRRIRSADDLRGLFDLPVLGVLAKERNAKRRPGVLGAFSGRPKAPALLSR